ncbi:MAG: hypothetical protein U1D67_08395 [Dehalococcoidia bacterium]|nr:hypothetical protein [Dehalococcoidia bacterium]
MKIGDHVKILECHSIPDLVGKEGKIAAELTPDISQYPFMVVLTEPFILKTEHGQAQTKGPFPFRENELELVDTSPDHGIPDVFKTG